MKDLIQKAFSCSTLKEGLDFFYDYLKSRFKVDYFKLYLLHPGQTFLIPRFLYGENIKNWGPVSLHEDYSTVVSCFKTNQEKWIPNVPDSDYSHNKLFRKQNINAFLGIPFLNQGVAAIEFFDANPPVSWEELSLQSKTFLTVVLNRFFLSAVKEEIRQSLKEMESQIAFSNKLSSLGQLAGSLAHEIKNPLTTINMLINQLLEDVDRESLIFHDVQIIQEEIERIKRLLTQFLDFAKPKAPHFEKIQLEKIIKNILQMVRLPLKEKNVDIRFSLKDGGWIKGDRDQVQQILVNLILNALEAVPGNTGKIDFYGEKTLKHGTRYYHLRIEDNGVGLPKDKIAAIFEPFFSEKGKGTGLGLSIVHRLMENHGGLIEAYNLLYGGACFSLYFPIQ